MANRGDDDVNHFYFIPPPPSIPTYVNHRAKAETLSVICVGMLLSLSPSCPTSSFQRATPRFSLMDDGESSSRFQAQLKATYTYVFPDNSSVSSFILTHCPRLVQIAVFFGHVHFMFVSLNTAGLNEGTERSLRRFWIL